MDSIFILYTKYIQSTTWQNKQCREVEKFLNFESVYYLGERNEKSEVTI